MPRGLGTIMSMSTQRSQVECFIVSWRAEAAPLGLCPYSEPGRSEDRVNRRWRDTEIVGRPVTRVPAVRHSQDEGVAFLVLSWDGHLSSRPWKSIAL